MVKFWEDVAQETVPTGDKKEVVISLPRTTEKQTTTLTLASAISLNAQDDPPVEGQLYMSDPAGNTGGALRPIPLKRGKIQTVFYSTFEMYYFLLHTERVPVLESWLNPKLVCRVINESDSNNIIQLTGACEIELSE